MSALDAARQLIRYALEQEACWSRLHAIVEEERERIYPEMKRAPGMVYLGPARRAA